MNNLGTWIDWQYLQNAAKLLAKVLLPLPASVTHKGKNTHINTGMYRAFHTTN
jgi:hypothetical protein